MANANAYKKIGPLFSNEIQLVKLTYDFSKDTGAQGNYELGKLGAKCLVVGAHTHVETACTSGGSATVTIGAASADADAFLTTAHGAVANLTDDAVWAETAGQLLVIAKDDTIRLTIGTADLTAGKINVYLQVMAIA